MIYAALTNGPKTFLLTNDELRNHVHLLPSGELRQNFLRWQRTQQITIEPFDAKSKTLKLKVHRMFNENVKLKVRYVLIDCKYLFSISESIC